MSFLSLFYWIGAGATLILLVVFYKVPAFLLGAGLTEKYVHIMTGGITVSVFFYVSNITV